MTLWEAKTTSGGTYDAMKTPSSYVIEMEDLDKDSYRSINTGNLIDTVVSKSWTKAGFKYNRLTAAETNTLLATLNANPIYVKITHPFYSSTTTKEMQMRCSKKAVQMLEDHSYTLEFNLVQKTKVTGQ